MRLTDYLYDNEIPLTDFARQLGVPVTTLHGYVSGRRRPPVDIVAAIERLTESAVRAADFVETNAA